MTFGQPLINPFNADGRFAYETGRQGSFQIPISAVPVANFVAFEQQSNIAAQPCWLLSMFVAVPIFAVEVPPNIFVLIYDLNPNDAATATAIANAAPARITFGPVLGSLDSGGTIVYEASAEDVPCRIQHPNGSAAPSLTVSRGIPFNFGITAVASSTARVPTPVADGMAIFARLQS